MNRILKFWTDLFPVWVVLASILACVKPHFFLPLKNHVSWYFAFTMLDIGSPRLKGSHPHSFEYPVGYGGSIYGYAPVSFCIGAYF